jgi:uncharacterized protein (TIGR02147 family)
MSKILILFDYSSYRQFIKDWIEEAKSQRTSNLSRLAEALQVHPTFLSHVLGGGKDLSLEQAALLGSHLELTPLEVDYLFALIQLERAGNSKLKAYWKEKKLQIEIEKNRLNRRFEKHRDLSPEQRAIFYSSWLFAATWSATAIDEGQTISQIAERFRLNREKASEILNFLTQTGLCHEEAGKFKLGEQHIHVPNESPFVIKHHTNWRIKAIERMDDREPAELFFTAPMSIAKSDFEVLREKLNRTIQDVVKVAKDSQAEEVVCLNIDFFRTQRTN